MTGRTWWGVLVAYGVVLWAAALAFPAAMSSLSDSWSYDGGELPVEAIVSNFSYSLAPAVLTAALAVTVTTIVLLLARTGRPAPAPAQDSEDPWEQDAVLLTR